MIQFAKDILQKIENEITQVCSDDMVSLEQTSYMVNFIKPLFLELRVNVSSFNFENGQDEIEFFKRLKPEILSRYLYYNKISNIITKCPIGSKETQREYFISELGNLKYFFDRNLDFYQYYRSKATHLDNCYFIRSAMNFQLCTDSSFLDKDPAFSTGFDYKVAKILCNDMLNIYLNQQLLLLDKKQQSDTIKMELSDFKLKWTGTKSEAIEWGYGLFAAKTLNYGNATIKEVMAFIEAAFDIELGDYYRTYLSLKNRKKDRTPQTRRSPLPWAQACAACATHALP